MKNVEMKLEGTTLSVQGTIDRLSAVRIDEFAFHSPSLGSQLNLRVAMDGLQSAPEATAAQAQAMAREGEKQGLIPGRKSLSVVGEVSQDLGLLNGLIDKLALNGQVSMPFQVESGDLSVFRITGALKAKGVNVEMPEKKIALKNFSGNVPILQDIALLPDGAGVRLFASASKNLYSRARFADVHPFLNEDNFLAIERVSVMGQDLGPIAGNLRVSRQEFALDQLQVGFRGGSITGQLIVDYNLDNPRVAFKGNVTGIRPTSSKEVLDANATLNFLPRKLLMDGRVEVVRIGRQHLQDVLDALDPYHENPNINRARMGLKVGYPKFLRFMLQHGFLNIKLELGGAAASLVALREIRGIALGPILNRYVAPLMPQGDK